MSELSRRTLLKLTAAVAAASVIERRDEVRLWLVEPNREALTPVSDAKRRPTTYRDVPAERLVASIKLNEMAWPTAHRARDLAPGDALMRRKVNMYDPVHPDQFWIVCCV